MRLIKNMSYTLFSNLLSILVSALIVLIIPRFIGVREYGFWQLYVFYASYVGVLHFGWADGLFLRRGGQQAEKIDAPSLKAETVLFMTFNAVIGLFVICIGISHVDYYRFIFMSLGLTVFFANVRTWITMILQSTGNFREYAINLSAQSLMYLSLIFVILLFHLFNYQYMIAAYIISQIATVISGFIQLRKVFKETKSTLNFKKAAVEIKYNVSAGFKLMVANSTAMLIIGIIRFGIQQRWSVTIFGKISLILSIANLLMVFINAVSLVLFPALRRTKQIARDVYTGIKSVLLPFLYMAMALYFPIRLIIPIWLPQYVDTLHYAAVLMPMMVYQGKFEVLSNTFMKNFRMEGTLMVINIVSLVISFALTVISIYMLHNIDFAVFSIAIVLGIRSSISEVVLSKRISVHCVKDIIIENTFVLGFMFLNWNFSIELAFVVYSIAIIIYASLSRRSIFSGILVMRELSKY
ncbi:Integral membrane protein [Levilactobacillus brevis]|uniref:Polysaccharide biosynthesis protein n=3 Tax=Levilactobacillus brevis TaxID=1580 RepID=U2P0E7_LEVBR|nr:polysaccharide biosynthesis protein [Levilactobacillus brevis]ERK43880.1 polysaccharide biosynthesis protein [Levilactobacillus brevis ATCC 14869 = DSM 20054]KIO99548.1 Membrane protein involved in the export of O-antigen, teichoic acid lipoteichoic acid [Levilactobacillus brevis]MCT3571441.1 hypothetical protein [Levilactobacillus brevis]SQG81455.1 Integral membrane protein [Levilactobacillus brevis]